MANKAIASITILFSVLNCKINAKGLKEKVDGLLEFVFKTPLKLGLGCDETYCPNNVPPDGDWHYGWPGNSCLEDETQLDLSDFDKGGAVVCASECDAEFKCPMDLPPGSGGAPSCEYNVYYNGDLAFPNGTCFVSCIRYWNPSFGTTTDCGECGICASVPWWNGNDDPPHGFDYGICVYDA